MSMMAKKYNYFCSFCQETDFKDRKDIEEHIGSHVFKEKRKAKRDELLYAKKMIKYHLDNMEYTLRCCSEDRKQFSRKRGNSFKIWKGCPTCDVIIAMVGDHVAESISLLENKTYKSHVTLHLGLLFFCAFCEFRAKVQSEVIKHCTTKHGKTAIKCLTPKLLPQMHSFMSNYRKSDQEEGQHFQANVPNSSKPFVDVSVFADQVAKLRSTDHSGRNSGQRSEPSKQITIINPVIGKLIPQRSSTGSLSPPKPIGLRIPPKEIGSINIKKSMPDSNPLKSTNFGRMKYFCLFCPSNNFLDEQALKIHLNKHFNAVKRNANATEYIKKWVDNFTDFQFKLIQTNKENQKTLIVNLCRNPRTNNCVWKGCIVCDRLCQAYNYQAEPSLIVIGKDRDCFSRLVQHMHLHMRATFLCSLCEYSHLKEHFVTDHMQKNHNRISTVLSPSLVPEFTILIEEYLKNYGSFEVYHPIIPTLSIIQLRDNNTKKDENMKEKEDVIQTHQDIEMENHVQSSDYEANGYEIIMEEIEEEKEDEVKSEQVVQVLQKDGLDDTIDEQSFIELSDDSSDNCYEVFDLSSVIQPKVNLNIRYFCVFCPLARFYSQAETKLHYKTEHFKDVVNQQNMAYYIRWLDCHLDFQQDLLEINNQSKIPLILNLSEDSKEATRVWNGCPVCEIYCDLYDYIPDKKLIIFTKPGSKSMKKHISEHLGWTSFCFWCDYNDFDDRQVVNHAEMEHPGSICQSLQLVEKNIFSDYIQKCMDFISSQATSADETDGGGVST